MSDSSQAPAADLIGGEDMLSPDAAALQAAGAPAQSADAALAAAAVAGAVASQDVGEPSHQSSSRRALRTDPMFLTCQVDVLQRMECGV